MKLGRRAESSELDDVLMKYNLVKLRDEVEQGEDAAFTERAKNFID